MIDHDDFNQNVDFAGGEARLKDAEEFGNDKSTEDDVPSTTRIASLIINKKKKNNYYIFIPVIVIENQIIMFF